jgi:hypothetical protein
MKAILCLFVAGALAMASVTAASAGMVVDLGETSHYIKLSNDYSNAAVAAILPYFSEAATKLGLPIHTPIVQADILRSHVLTFRDLEVSVMLRDRWAFTYSHGVVDRITDSRGFSALQDPAQIKRYYGTVAISQDDAVKVARTALTTLGIPLDVVFADQPPVVVPPPVIDSNTVPDFEIKWLDPRGGQTVDIHVNGSTRRVERLALFSKNISRKNPQLTAPVVADPDWPPVNPAYASQLIPLMFQAVDNYAKKLGLPVPPLTTNNVANITITDNEGWPHAEISLTNGWRFIYRHAMVNGYYSPHVLFSVDSPNMRIKAFQGKWNISEGQAIEAVRLTLAKLGFATNNVHMGFAPTVTYAQGDYQKTIPRYFFSWNFENAAKDDLQSKVEAEVNADDGHVESLYYDDKVYWGARPAVTAPISLGHGYPHIEMKQP